MEGDAKGNHHEPRCHRTGRDDVPIRYEATGAVAHARLAPLLPEGWVDVGAAAKTGVGGADAATTSPPVDLPPPDFLWENAPRRDANDYRDHVRVYSHLPNGSATLDSKWVLGRLLAPTRDGSSATTTSRYDPLLLAACETHCFCGLDGFEDFAQRMALMEGGNTDADGAAREDGDATKRAAPAHRLPDILDGPPLPRSSSSSPAGGSPPLPPPAPNLWVVKDAAANGAGGVWVVGAENAAAFAVPSTSPLYPHHRYVAQRYVWPPVLFGGKKFHVRAYAAIACDGSAYVHRRAFLHVANEPFTTHFGGGGGSGGGGGGGPDDVNDGKDPIQKHRFDDCVHITNCCANSHDGGKFAGEILADFDATHFTEVDGQRVIPLADFFPSVQATVVALVERAFPFMEGGQRNNGFEYCGMDFMLSYRASDDGDDGGGGGGNATSVPVAYLLEINAPPSQDTATGLPHAENLHDEVLGDWMDFWVVPRVLDVRGTASPGGWKCVMPKASHPADERGADMEEPILPSKAAILNKIRWALYERKLQKQEALSKSEEERRAQRAADGSTVDDRNGTKRLQQEDGEMDCHLLPGEIATFARSQFPFFSSSSCIDGGINDNTSSSQRQTIFFENAGGAQVPQTVIDCMSASLRHRHRSTVGSKTKAAARATALRILGASESGVAVLGLNSTSLLASLAQRYVQCNLLSSTDEVVISTENHRANFDPWVTAATQVGAKIKLWTPFARTETSESSTSMQSCRRLQDLITSKTRIVALPHASNVVGCVRSMDRMSKMIKARSSGYAHIVVDGVASSPHIYAQFDAIPDVDWYVVSMHKLFGPHVGVLLARRGRAMDQFSVATGFQSGSDESVQEIFESGTANIEGCAGVVGLGMYLKSLANMCHPAESNGETKQGEGSSTGEGVVKNAASVRSLESVSSESMVSSKEVEFAYRLIRRVEESLVEALIRGLSQSPQVRILSGQTIEECDLCDGPLIRLPIVSFVHQNISASSIYKFCEDHDIACRHGLFLCTNYMALDLGFQGQDGALRLSLAHYNTLEEVEHLCTTLGKMQGWH